MFRRYGTTRDGWPGSHERHERRGGRHKVLRTPRRVHREPLQYPSQDPAKGNGGTEVEEGSERLLQRRFGEGRGFYGWDGGPGRSFANRVIAQIDGVTVSQPSDVSVYLK